jgi:hypothetical protein
MEATTIDISYVLGEASKVVTQGLEWLGETADAIASNPLLLFTCVIGLVGMGIGLFQRVFRV